MSDGLRRVAFAREAWEELVEQASQELMRETGGILLGWRITDGVHVDRIIEVPDRDAGHTRYRRRHPPAEAALAAALDETSGNSPIGYVGEWHTHPAPVGPSFLDRCELRRISGKTVDEVALVVAAYHTGTRIWTPTALTAHRRRTRQALVEFAPRQPDPILEDQV